MIPSRLRNELKLVPGEEYFFFTHEENGHSYICIEANRIFGMTIEQAKSLLRQNGIKIEEDEEE